MNSKRYENDKYLKISSVINFFVSIFIFPLLLGMIVYANEFETKGKQKLTEINI